MTIEEIKEKLNRDDRFCRYNEMRIDVIRPGYAEAVMDITENKLNGLGIAQGGLPHRGVHFEYLVHPSRHRQAAAGGRHGSQPRPPHRRLQRTGVQRRRQGGRPRHHHRIHLRRKALNIRASGANGGAFLSTRMAEISIIFPSPS